MENKDRRLSWKKDKKTDLRNQLRIHYITRNKIALKVAVEF